MIKNSYFKLRAKTPISLNRNKSSKVPNALNCNEELV